MSGRGRARRRRRAPSVNERYPAPRRWKGLAAVIAGAALLAWTAPRVNPWDLTQLAAVRGEKAVRLGLWGQRLQLPAWTLAAGAALAALTLLLALTRRTAPLRRSAQGALGCAALLFSLFPTGKSWELVTGLVAGTLGVVLVTAGLLALAPSLFDTTLRFRTVATARLEAVPTGIFLVLVFGFVFTLANLGSYFLFGHIPHIVDAMDQLFHAKMFVQGELTAPAPEPADFFYFTHMIADGRWYSQYPPGHTLLLAGGLLLRAPWLVNPLFGALSVVLLYFIGREAYDELTGRVSALLAALSPFLLIMSSSFMNHTTTLFYLEVFLLGFVRMVRRPSPFAGLLVGTGLGYALTIRTMTAAAVALPFGVYAVWHALRVFSRGERAVTRRLVTSGLIAALALAVPVSALLTFNHLTNGDSLLFGYEVLHGKNALPGFGKSGWWDRPHTPLLGLQASLRNLNALNLYLLGLPLPSLAFALLGLAWLRLRVWDALFLASAGSLATAYFFYWYQDWALGPRFLYSSLAPLILVTARAILAFPKLAAGARTPEARDRLLAAGLALVTIAYAYGLTVHVPMFAAFYSRNYADANPALLRAVDQVSGSPSLAFVPYLYHPTLFPLNDPFLRGPVIYALHLGPDKNSGLAALHRDRRAYRLFALEEYTFIEYGSDQFPHRKEYPLVAGTPLTIEALSFQVSHFRGDSLQDERTTELGSGWKNHDHLLVGARAIGAEVGFLVRADRAQTRLLRVALTRGPEFGIVAVLCNGQPLTTIDLYAERPMVQTQVIRAVPLDAGRNAFVLRGIGKNRDSAGFGLGVDYISLE